MILMSMMATFCVLDGTVREGVVTNHDGNIILRHRLLITILIALLAAALAANLEKNKGDRNG